jgi:murein DD-endopeptidase MepM/ murein hydrolase activator NlpD
MFSASPPRRAAALTLALVILGCLFATPPRAGAQPNEELHQARKELRETKAKIRARAAKLRVIQRGLNLLATEISVNEGRIEQATEQIESLEEDIAVLDARTSRLEEKLSDRNREAYILGPGVPVMFLLTATSAADAAARMSVLTEMNRRDGVLANKVAQSTQRLDRARAEYARIQRARQLALQQLAVDQAELRRRLAASRRLFEQLRARKEAVLDEISRIRPFAVCPVRGPVAIADDFGIWVHRSKERGGDHVHQGNDMMAAMGTPIVAPFDGTAVASPNKLGGNAVKVFGKYGYVYNAHLSRYGKLGPVQTGDVIGYVGATGNTDAPHDHFEWHPGNGAAVDPHPYLMMVC